MKNNISILGVGTLTQSLLASLHANNFKGKIYLHDIDKSKKLGWTFSFLSGHLDDGCSSLSLVSSKNQNLIKFSDTLQLCK